MKKNWRSNLTIAVLLLSLLELASCNRGNEHAEHADTYTCPMHPTVVSDKPSTCPVCGMDLVRKARPGEEVEITRDIAKNIKSPNENIISSVRSIKGEFKSMPVSLEAQGLVTYDTRNIFTIPARIGGRLEKVFLKYTYQQVKKGQKVAEIYSPELLNVQRELLYLLANDPDNKEIIKSAKDKLFLLGATQSQIDEIINRKEASYTFSIYSPSDGYVIREGQQAPSLATTSALAASPMGGGMDGSSATTTPSSNAAPVNASTSELIREGNYVATGQTLFKVVNISALRIELNLPVAQAGRIKLNNEVKLRMDHTILKGKVDFVQPFFTEGEEFVKVRLYLGNSGDLLIGQLVTGTIQLSPVEALWVPREAVLDLGLDKVVFIKDHDAYRPIKVKVGARADGWLEIIQGLSSSDEIASNAQYLVDSESFIKVK